MRLYALLGIISFSLGGAVPNHRHGSGEPPVFYKGFDLSSLKIMEDGGAVYKDTARGNCTRPVEDILGDGGMNTVRLRLWVNPTVPYDDGYYETYSLPYTLSLAKRFHQKRYKIYLDYHFSDYWSDPQKQTTPAAWPTKLEPLAATLRHYVSSTLSSFSKAGIDLSIVSLGNEIRHGMLWPLGRADVDVEPLASRIRNFTGLATLYAAAREGVRDALAASEGTMKPPEVMIHIDNGWNLTLQERWFDALTATGLVDEKRDWDVIGLSMYPFYGTAAKLADLKRSLDTLAKRYRKPVHVVETDWPAVCKGEKAPTLSEKGIGASVEGQMEWVRRIVEIVKQVPGGLGRGVNYWEPAWLNNTALGSGCQDAILFEGDWSRWPGEVVGWSRESVDMFKDV